MVFSLVATLLYAGWGRQVEAYRAAPAALSAFAVFSLALLGTGMVVVGAVLSLSSLAFVAVCLMVVMLGALFGGLLQGPVTTWVKRNWAQLIAIASVLLAVLGLETV